MILIEIYFHVLILVKKCTSLQVLDINAIDVLYQFSTCYVVATFTNFNFQ